jgi:hypothetical protein
LTALQIVSDVDEKNSDDDEKNSDTGDIEDDGEKYRSNMELKGGIGKVDIEDDDANESNKHDDSDGSGPDYDKHGNRRPDRKEKQPCEHWINPKLGCGRGNRCPHSHDQPGYVETARSKSRKKLITRKRKRNRARKQAVQKMMQIDQQN